MHICGDSGLLDPKWREQKERQIREKKEAETVYAAGVNIEENLRGIAERRTDIFGIGVEEAEIGKKVSMNINVWSLV